MLEGEPGQRALLAAVMAAERIVVLTGAGVSTECGVPDFRSPDSPWRRFPPIPFTDWLASPAMRVEAWRRKFAIDDLSKGARPGRTHRALVALARTGRLRAVITQNIDGLHQAAGLAPSSLVELHGNGTFARCLSCGTRHELDDVRRDLASGEAPACECGGMVKSATIAFGQPLDRETAQRAQAAALDCDLILVLGSSLLVRPAASLPVLAQRQGAVFGIVNREPTRLDEVADLVVRGDVGHAVASWTDLF